MNQSIKSSGLTKKLSVEIPSNDNFMWSNYNIYEELNKLLNRVSSLENEIERLNNIITNIEVTEENKIPNNKIHYTVKQILIEFQISRQTFFNYRNIVELNDCGKIGKFKQFKSEDVMTFFEKIKMMKKTNPEFFKFELKKAS